ncbi:MAG: hypothetical protein HW380_681 [Magnetococcales bacterium]|nr:hypothetical protein [Magnetococcales bacterium]
MKNQDEDLDRFRSELERADWHYNMSDDHRVWNEGRENLERLWRKAKKMGGEWKIAYSDACKRNNYTG